MKRLPPDERNGFGSVLGIIQIIPDQRMTDRLHMNADLMRPAGFKPE